MSRKPATLVDLLAPVAAERIAIILADDGTRVTYASLREQVQEVADTFAGLGIGRGDRVAMAVRVSRLTRLYGSEMGPTEPG